MNGLGQVLIGGEKGVHQGQEQLGIAGQMHPLLGAEKQGEPDLRLQGFPDVAHAGLGVAHPVAAAGEVQRLGHIGEKLQLLDVHGRSFHEKPSFL